MKIPTTIPSVAIRLLLAALAIQVSTSNAPRKRQERNSLGNYQTAPSNNGRQSVSRSTRLRIAWPNRPATSTGVDVSITTPSGLRSHSSDVPNLTDDAR